jgi:hypothetical protein
MGAGASDMIAWTQTAIARQRHVCRAEWLGVVDKERMRRAIVSEPKNEEWIDSGVCLSVEDNQVQYGDGGDIGILVTAAGFRRDVVHMFVGGDDEPSCWRIGNLRLEGRGAPPRVSVVLSPPKRRFFFNDDNNNKVNNNRES